ncbi:hypothetical protein TB2_008035 [Malus domestica]
MRLLLTKSNNIFIVIKIFFVLLSSPLPHDSEIPTFSTANLHVLQSTTTNCIAVEHQIQTHKSKVALTKFDTRGRYTFHVSLPFFTSGFPFLLLENVICELLDVIGEKATTFVKNWGFPWRKDVILTSHL